MSDKDHYDIWNKSQQINNIMLDFIFYKLNNFFCIFFIFSWKYDTLLKRLTELNGGWIQDKNDAIWHIVA
jgi:hypothetical protein